MQKIGLALSGGGIKSFSQLPVIATLAHENIAIDAVSGTSMGSVIAALVATGAPADTIIKKALEMEQEISDKKILSRPSTKILPFTKEKLIGGFIDGQDLEDVLASTLSSMGFVHLSDVKVPLIITAVDMVSGKTVLFVSHPELYTNTDPDAIVITDISLAKAVRASCSFPFVIAAMPFQDLVLVDGGLRQNLPLKPLYDYGVTKTIAVTMHTDEEFSDFANLMAMAVRVMDIMRVEADRQVIDEADVHINIPMDKVWVFEVGKGQQSIAAGQAIIRDHVAELKKLSVEESWWQRLLHR